MWSIIYKFASPKWFYQMSDKLVPCLAALSLVLFSYGAYSGLFLAPADYQQGDSFRIIYVHVPAAFLSLTVYMTMAIAAGIGLIWQIKLADMVAAASAPIGASFTFLALFTGALWGKPMWGTWWVWDARLTSELILLFLYFGFMALQAAIPDRNQATRASAILALVGMVNVPIIHYSVTWWHTLHQGPTLSKFAKPSMSTQMLYPLLAMIVAFFVFYLLLLCLRLRCEIIKREKNSRWLQDSVKEGAS